MPLIIASSPLSVVPAVLVLHTPRPKLAGLVAGDHLDEPLARLKDWLERHTPALVAVILVVIGLRLSYKGIHALR